MNFFNRKVDTMSLREDSHDGRGSPLVVAAYKQGDPSRKRRVKVPPNIKWTEFLDLFYHRFDVSRDLAIEIYDEKGIEIVSTEDLLQGDVLVVKEATKTRSPSQNGAAPSADETRTTSTGSPLPSAPPLNLEHFIQASSLGYYFLGKGSSSLRTHGKLRQVHCIVKVPHPSFQQPLRSEASLLSVIAGHKGIIAAPSVCTFNSCSDDVQQLFRRLTEEKRRLLQDLLTSPDHTSTAYVYPLYGVTMTTKIKSDLVPGVVLRYSYQLADIMYYLEDKGVVHLNLLPENIQVMSNDRIVLCNFETAIRTDESKRLVGNVANVMIPKNKKSLSPETVSALTNLRSDTNTIDFSGQYTWNFGVLAVLFSTGQHPLKNYPEQYESQGLIKYKSVNYQTLPDPNKYPPLFIKLVRRALSCDPPRRPTIIQILSLIKRDTKIITLMAEHRETQGLSSTPAQASSSPLQGSQSVPSSEQSASHSVEPVNRDPSPDHSYENFAMKWYCDDPESLPQNASNEMNYFPTLPPSNHSTVSQGQPSDDSQGFFSSMSQNPFPLPNASQTTTTQDGYFHSHASQNFFSHSSVDSVGWFPVVPHSQYDSKRTDLKLNQAGSLSTLNSAFQEITKTTKDEAAKQSPQMSSQKKVVRWEEPDQLLQGVTRSDTSSSEHVDRSNQVSPSTSSQAQQPTAKSDSNLAPSTGGPLGMAWEAELAGQETGENVAKAKSQRGVAGQVSGLLQWTGKGGSGPLWPSCRMDTDSINDIAASTPDITKSSNGHSKRQLYRRRRSFSGFVPASLYTISTSSSPVPPFKASSLVLPLTAPEHGTAVSNEESSAGCTPCLDTKKATGQVCMSPIPEASQEVPLSSQLLDNPPVTDNHTSPFRHISLAEDLTSRNSSMLGGASMGKGPSMRGALMGGASSGGPSMRGASMGEGPSMRGASTGEGPSMRGASMGEGPSMRGASTGEGPSMRGASTGEGPSMRGASMGEGPSMRGASMGEGPSMRGASTGEGPSMRGASTGEGPSMRGASMGEGPSMRGASMGEGPSMRGASMGEGPSMRGASTGEGPSMRGASMGEGPSMRGASTGEGPSMRGASMGEGPSMRGASMGEGPSMRGASMGEGPSMRGASMGEGPSMRGVSMGEGPSMRGASTGEGPSMRGASMGEGPSMRGASTGEGPSMRGASIYAASMGGALSVPAVSMGGAGSSLSAIEQGTHTQMSSKRPSLVARRQAATGAKSSTQSQRQRHMSWDLEVLNRAYSDMDLAERRTPGGVTSVSLLRNDPPTSHHTSVASTSMSTAVTTTSTHIRQLSQQLPMERVLHGRQVQYDGTHQVPSQVVTTPAGSVPPVASHPSSHNTRVSLSQQVNSVLTDQPSTHSLVPRPHSPPVDHVVATSSTISTSAHYGTPATSCSASGPGHEDRPSFLEPPPSYEEIFGSRAVSSQTLPVGQTLASTSGRFASVVSFFRRWRRREVSQSMAASSTSLQHIPTQVPSPELPSRNSPPSSSLVPVHGQTQPLTSVPSHSSFQPTWTTASPRTSVQGTVMSSHSDGGRSGGVPARSDGGRSGTVAHGDGGRSGGVPAHGDGGRSGGVPAHSNSGRSGAVDSAIALPTSQQDVSERRVNPPYRHPPPFVPAPTRGSFKPAAARNQTRVPPHDHVGAPTTQLITGSDHRSLYLTSNATQEPVQLRTTSHRRGIRQRPHSEMIPDSHPQLQFTYPEEDAFNCSQVPPLLLQSGSLSASCTNIETLPSHHAVPPSSQRGAVKTRRVPNNISGPGHTSLPASNASSTFKTIASTSSTAPSSAPSNTSVSPSNVSVAPCRTSFAPSNASHVPSNTSLAPSNTSSAPSNTSSAPSNTSSAPSNTSSAPSNTSLAPSNTSSAPSNTSSAPSNTSSAPSNTSLAPSNTSSAPSNTSSAPSNTSSAPSNTSSAPSDTSHAPSNIPSASRNMPLAPSNTTSTPSSTSAAPSNTSLAPGGTFSPVSSTSTCNHASASSSTSNNATSASSSTSLAHNNTLMLSNTHNFSIPSHDASLTILKSSHTSMATTSTAPLPVSTESTLGLQNTTSSSSFQLVPTCTLTSTVCHTTEPCSLQTSGHHQSEVPHTSRQQRLPQSRNVLHVIPSEGHVTPANNSLCQPITEETIQTDINRGRKSCGHLCLKERRFCCLCQYNGHREISQEECCLLCSRHSTGDLAILRSSSLGNCHSGDECTCDQNEFCSLHRGALSQPVALAEGPRRPASQNCLAM